MTVTTLLPREDFRQWLATKEPDEVVGNSGTADGCPAATWLSTTRGEHCSVSRFLVLSFPRGSCSMLVPPAWLRAFMDNIDLPGEGREITAKEALTVLDGIDG